MLIDVDRIEVNQHPQSNVERADVCAHCVPQINLQGKKENLTVAMA